MKYSITFALIIVAICSVSCNDGNNNIQYKKHMSHNKAYEVEIPTNLSQHSSIANLMTFSNEKDFTILMIDALKDGESLHDFAEKSINNGSDKLHYSSYEQTDSSYFFSATTGMATSYNLYMSKKLNDIEYVIFFTTPVMGKSKAEGVIHHVRQSLTAHSNEMEVIDGKDAKKGKSDNFVSRSTNYYSIEYPKEWKVLTNVDQMTDAYIGAANDLLGFTIVFFDTDYSLAEINEESNSNMRELNAKFSTNKKITINGQPCYKSVYEYDMAGKHLKNISYVFKKGETMYSVKFGSDPKEIDNNLGLIDKIINTFHIK